MEQYEDAVRDWLIHEEGYDEESATSLATTARGSIVEDYIPDGPGWCGDILTVVFGFDEAIHNFRVIKNKKHSSVALEHITPEWHSNTD